MSQILNLFSLKHHYIWNERHILIILTSFIIKITTFQDLISFWKNSLYINKCDLGFFFFYNLKIISLMKWQDFIYLKVSFCSLSEILLFPQEWRTLMQWFSSWGLWSSSISVTWGLTEMQMVRHHSNETHWVRNSGVGPSSPSSNKLSRWLFYS